VYIHWDGYPKGAAHYIADAIGYRGDYEKTETLTAERFIRENEEAGLTTDHYAHGDTDYRYDFYRLGEMSVSKRTIERVGDEYEERWDLIYQGNIGVFLVDNYKPEDNNNGQ
jgi:hypothetical protein